MSYSIVNFGRYEGKTLPQIIFNDPDWFFWAWEQNIFKNKGVLNEEADELYEKACCIKPPSRNGQDMEAEYFIHRPTMKFSRMNIVPVTQPQHEGSSPTFRAAFIDLRIPRKIAPYDKLGCKILIRSVKFYFFGSTDTHLTRKRCDEFFENPDNFLTAC